LESGEEPLCKVDVKEIVRTTEGTLFITNYRVSKLCNTTLYD